jgi:hypothetical protein
MKRISGKSLQQVLASRQRMLTRRMLDYCALMSRTFTLQGSHGVIAVQSTC